MPGCRAHAPGRFALLVFALGLVSEAAIAQVPPRIVPPAGSPLPSIRPQVAPEVQPGSLLPVPSDTGGTVPQRDVAVRAVSVDGVTIYPAAQIAKLTEGLTGAAVPLARIDAARLAILRRYRDQGYVLTAVSAVLESGGVLHFRVTEGHIAEVKLDGDIGPAGTQVLRYLNRLTEPAVIDADTLERYLLLAQDIPGVTVRAVLKPSTQTPGALTLVAQVSRRTFTSLFTADNRAFDKTGPEQGLAVLDINSLTEFGERTELSLYRSANGTQIFGQASVEVLLGSSGLRARLYGGAGDALPSGDLRAVGYDAYTTVFGTEVRYPVIRLRQQTLNVFGQFDASETTDSQSNLPGGPETPISVDSVRALRAGADYALADLWLGDERPGLNGVTVRVSRGLPGLGATANNTATVARPGEQHQFIKATIDASRTQTLFTPWEGASIGVMGVVAGQVSNAVLPPTEQYFLGGARLGRGFYSGQVVGDNALEATAELQLNTSLGFSLLASTPPMSAQFYLFYDWGEAWQNQNTNPNGRLQSFGLGTRVAATAATEVYLEGVRRLTRYPNGMLPGVSALDSYAFYWRVLSRF